jgi:diaminopropionate ammonia-lyase
VTKPTWREASSIACRRWTARDRLTRQSWNWIARAPTTAVTIGTSSATTTAASREFMLLIQEWTGHNRPSAEGRDPTECAPPLTIRHLSGQSSAHEPTAERRASALSLAIRHHARVAQPPEALSRNWFSRPAAREWLAPGPSGNARGFHEDLPGYRVTPLVELADLAAELSVRRVLVKDESSRLGLPAFKILGASWGTAQVVAARTGASLNLAALRAAAAGSGLRLVSATDGNHGRAVAHMANLMGVAATVFVPAVMTEQSEASIRAEGAEVVRTDGDYDDAVRRAAAFTDEDDARELVQDTAWDGYEQVPAWIVEGYETLLDEVDEGLGAAPNLVAVPVGVGSLAQAVVTHYRRNGSGHPCVLSVEPDVAACVLASLRSGARTSIETGVTNMAGLNCGTPSSAAWPVLLAGCDAAVAVTDDAADLAVTDLARLGVSSGPSGAATLAGVRAALGGPGSETRRRELGIDRSSTVVLLSTEGRQQPPNTGDRE